MKSKQFVYLKIADRLKERIVSGMYKVDEVLPSQKILAEEFSINRATLRKAIEILEKEGIIECITSSGTYVKKNPKKNMLIGYLVRTLKDPFHIELIHELDNLLSEIDAGIIVAEGNDPRRLIENGITKIILAGQYDSITIDTIDTIDQAGDCEIISMGLENFPMKSVSIINKKGMNLLYNHLRELGHTKISFLSSSVIEVPVDTNLRCNHLLKSMHTKKEKDFLRKNTFHLNIFNDNEQWDVIDRILSLRERPTALVCHSDWLAVEVLQKILSRGVRVPQDISITGFDNIYLSHMVSVPLTTIDYPKKETAEKLMRLLFSEKDDHMHLTCEPNLLIRQSTGPISKGSVII